VLAISAPAETMIVLALTLIEPALPDVPGPVVVLI
jgi:hypothetical protein